MGNCPKQISLNSSKKRPWCDLIEAESPAAFMNYSEKQREVTVRYEGSKTSTTSVSVRAVVDIPAYGELVWYKCENEDEDTLPA